MDVGGDSIEDLPNTVVPGWSVALSNMGEVTNPRIEFTCGETIDETEPPSHEFIPPPTYVWDYAGQTLTGQKWVFLRQQPILLDQTGFVCTRSVDQPMLTGDTTVQNMTFNLRFTQPIPAGITDLQVTLAGMNGGGDGFGVTETVLSGSGPSGWTSLASSPEQGAWWQISPTNVVVGEDYVFTAQVQSTRPAGETRTIYHMPWAYMGYSEVFRQTIVGTSATISHPQGATVDVSVSEVTEWRTNIYSRMRNHSLGTVSIPLEGTDLSGQTVEVAMGDVYDRAGALLGSSVHATAFGGNLLAGELVCPDGRSWSLRHDRDGGFYVDLEGSAATMTALSAVKGSYQVALHGPAGQTLTVPIDLSGTTPDAPDLIVPTEGQIIPPTGYLFQWDAPADPTLDGCNLYLESGDWEWQQLMPKDQTSVWVGDMPESSKVEGEFAIGFIAVGTTADGVDWSAIPFSNQKITAWTAFRGDANLDGVVDVSDLSVLATQYRQTTDIDWSKADFNADGIVDVSDLSLLATNYRKSLSVVPPSASVPEPTTLALLVVTAIGTLLPRRRRGAREGRRVTPHATRA